MTLVVIGAGLASVGDSFQWPALAASVPLMASEDDLPNYNGLIESGRAIGRFAGPAIGGLAIAFIGVTGLVAIEAVTFVLATVVVAVDPRAVPGARAASTAMARCGATLSLGFRWIFARQAAAQVPARRDVRELLSRDRRGRAAAVRPQLLERARVRHRERDVRRGHDPRRVISGPLEQATVEPPAVPVGCRRHRRDVRRVWLRARSGRRTPRSTSPPRP